VPELAGSASGLTAAAGPVGAPVGTLPGEVPVWLELELFSCAVWPEAWIASAPTATSETAVMNRTETVALRPDLGFAGA
jgi:hypothetical protein